MAGPPRAMPPRCSRLSSCLLSAMAATMPRSADNPAGRRHLISAGSCVWDSDAMSGKPGPSAASRAVGGGARHLRLGLYCSLPCLEQAAAGHLAEAQAVNAQADLARDSARIVKRAETMLHQGMT